MSDESLTAQDIACNLLGGPSGMTTAYHRLPSLHENEISLLLFKILPGIYFELGEAAKQRSVRKGFHWAFDLASEDVRRAVMVKFVTFLSTQGEARSDSYISGFFRASDLIYCSNEDAEFIKTRVFWMNERDAMLVILRGIGPFLRHTDVAGFLAGLMELFRRDDIRGKVVKLFQDEWGDIDELTQRTLLTGIKRWMERFQNEGRSDLADLLLEEFDLYDRPPIPVEIYP